MTRDRARFADPELQALYDRLAPAAGDARADSAEAIAARQGLALAADLAAVRRRSGGRSAAFAVLDRRSLESYAYTMLSHQAEHLRPAGLRTRARGWAQLGLRPEEMQGWIKAIGVDGAVVCRDCLSAGIALSAMNLVLDGVRVKHRLRGGEPAFSVLARAASSGHLLST